MKKIGALLFFVLIGAATSFAQTDTDSIYLKKVFGSYQFYFHNQKLSLSQIKNVMSSNELAYEQIKAAQSTNAIGMVFAYAGGFLVGWPLGTALGGGEPNWAAAGAGVALIAVTIGVNKSYNIKAKRAVDTYNNGLGATSFWDRSELRVGLTANGGGLIFRF